MRVSFGIVLLRTGLVVAATLGSASVSAEIRVLSQQEQEVLLNEFRPAAIASGFAETVDGRTVVRGATLYFPASVIAGGDCISRTLRLMTQGESTEWKLESDETAYFYWPDADCSRVDWTESISVGSVDSDSLGRIIDNASRILREAASIVPRDGGVALGEFAHIVSIGIVRDETANRLVFSVQFQVSECVGVEARVRLLDDIEVLSAIDTFCETRAYRGVPASMSTRRGRIVLLGTR
jgi:hypothetical protein